MTPLSDRPKYYATSEIFQRLWFINIRFLGHRTGCIMPLKADKSRKIYLVKVIHIIYTERICTYIPERYKNKIF